MENTLAIYQQDLAPAVLSLVQVPAPSVSFLDIRRDQATYPRLEAVPRDIAIAALRAIIVRATFNAAPGQYDRATQEEKIAIIAEELYGLLLEDYYGLGTKNLSFAEIARVIRAGSASRDFYGVSVRTLYSAVLDYCEGEGRKASQILQAERWNGTPTHRPIQAPDQERTALASTLETLTKNHKPI